MKLSHPKLVWFDEAHLRWKNVRWWHLRPIYYIVLFIFVLFAYLAGDANTRTLTKTEYIYFPCPVQKWQRGGAPEWKELYKTFEEHRFKEPVQLIINHK